VSRVLTDQMFTPVCCGFSPQVDKKWIFGSFSFFPFLEPKIETVCQCAVDFFVGFKVQEDGYSTFCHY